MSPCAMASLQIHQPSAAVRRDYTSRRLTSMLPCFHTPMMVILASEHAQISNCRAIRFP
jgi:hypothetical protein